MRRALFTGLALATTLAIAGPAFAQTTSVAGNWDVTIVSPQGPNTTRLSLKQGAEKLNGMFKSPMGELAVTGSRAASDRKNAFTIDLQAQSAHPPANGNST